MDGQNKAVVLLLTHKLNDEVDSLYRAIERGLGTQGDVKLLLHDEACTSIKSERTYPFTYDLVGSLGYEMIEKTLVPGSNHFPLFLFAKDNPQYSYYWVIEYDVRFNGCWSNLFTDYSEKKYDFCSCHIRAHDSEPDWPWWKLEHPTLEVVVEKRIRSFNTIYRISSEAINYLSQCLSSHWKGHHEVLMPTLLHNAGFTLNDFGGSGCFVEAGCEEKYYVSSKSNKKGILFSGSMRYRPCINNFSYGENKLYHPCK